MLRYIGLFVYTLLGVSGFSSEISREKYLELIKLYPRLIAYQGNFLEGEIEIVTDPEEMAAIEKETMRDVGIIAQDRYWIWINDACKFPSGKRGVYGRMLWSSALSNAYSGIAVMPLTSEGKIILNCNFRHATRSWEIELPRGCVDSGEEVEDAARREVIEETGMVVDGLRLLGYITPDTGFTTTIVPIYLANVIKEEESQRGDEEAIEEILSLSIEEVKEAFIQGFVDHTIRGKNCKIAFRDPFLAYALFMYQLHCYSSS